MRSSAGEKREGEDRMGLRQYVAAIALGLGVSVLAPTSLAQFPDLDTVEIQTTQLTEGIYMLVGAGGNIGVSAGKDGVFLIDDQLAPLTPKIQAAIAKISDQPIRFVLNTHWHFDHTSGNENLGKAGAVIVAQDRVRDRLKVDTFIKLLNRTIPAASPVALPLITFNDKVTFHLNGQTIHAFHVNTAHTDGDTVIHFREADVIHAGDVYFNGMYPYIDTASKGSVKGMIAAVEKVLALTGEDTQIIPGHGPLSKRAELVAYAQMLKTVRDRTQAAINQGISLADFIASKPTADYDDSWGNGFLKPPQFLTIVYTDLSDSPQ